MNTIQTEKNRLRSEIRAQGREMSLEARMVSDREITRALLATTEWTAAGLVFIYVSKGWEPDTRKIIEAGWLEGKRIAVPRCLQGGGMEAREIISLEMLKPNDYHILEPDDTCPYVSPKALELSVVPCLTADLRKHRLGNGGGYYDRYLREVSGSVFCLCRKAFMMDALPVEEWDIAVDKVLFG